MVVRVWSTRESSEILEERNTCNEVHYRNHNTFIMFEIEYSCSLMPSRYRMGEGGVQYRMGEGGVQYRMREGGVQYRMGECGVQYRMREGGVQYRMEEGGVQYSAYKIFETFCHCSNLLVSSEVLCSELTCSSSP